MQREIEGRCVPQSALLKNNLCGYSFTALFFRFPGACFVKRRVKCVEVFAVQIICCDSEPLTESLIVYDLSFSEEAYRVDNVGVITVAQNVVVCRTGFLLPKSCESTTRYGKVNLNRAKNLLNYYL